MDRKLVVAIDVDGVLRNNLGEMIRLYNEEFDDNKTEEDITDFRTEISFPRIAATTGITASSWFFQEHSKELFLDAKPYEFIAEDIRKIQEYAQVIIVTYQKSYLNKSQTLEWLEKNDINPDGIAFLKDKTILHSDYFVDDNDWNFIGSNAKNGVLIDMPYNKNKDISSLMEESHCERIVRCKNFHIFATMLIAKLKNGETA